jgi:hypothetical protein
MSLEKASLFKNWKWQFVGILDTIVKINFHIHRKYFYLLSILDIYLILFVCSRNRQLRMFVEYRN